MEEVPTREEVLAGMFFLNECSIIILFNFRASHDFISSTCAKKAMLSMVATEAPYVISTPGGWVDEDRIVQKALLELAERVFSINLIILKGQGLDVTLGMSWMKLYRAILDIAGRLVHLDSPDWFTWTHPCMIRSSSTFLRYLASRCPYIMWLS
jgi:hypothetical protein